MAEGSSNLRAYLVAPRGAGGGAASRMIGAAVLHMLGAVPLGGTLALEYVAVCCVVWGLNAFLFRRLALSWFSLLVFSAAVFGVLFFIAYFLGGVVGTVRGGLRRPLRGPGQAGRPGLLRNGGDDHRRRGGLRVLAQHHLLGVVAALRLPRSGGNLRVARRRLPRGGPGAHLRRRRAGADPLRHHAHQADRRGPEAHQRAPRPARRRRAGGLDHRRPSPGWR